MMYLVHLTSAGLALDIAGFLMVYLFRRGFVSTVSNRAPSNDEGKDGDYWVEAPGLSAKEAKQIQVKERRERCLVLMGVGAVLLGFVLQIIGSVAANLQLVD